MIKTQNMIRYIEKIIGEEIISKLQIERYEKVVINVARILGHDRVLLITKGCGHNYGYEAVDIGEEVVKQLQITYADFSISYEKFIVNCKPALMVYLSNDGTPTIR